MVMNGRIKILLLTALVASSPLYAKQAIKIVSRSADKIPVWMNGTEQGYIITSAIAADIETAKRICLDNIKSQILESVSENIEFSGSEISRQYTINDMTDFRSEFRSELKKQAADIPYIKGVSMSKAEESYWEERYDKVTKHTFFVLSVKYPFPATELRRMIKDFEERDAAMWQIYKEKKDGIGHITSYAGIESAVSALESIKNYFFDRQRREQVAALQGAYISLYKKISLITSVEELGSAKIACMLNGKEIDFGLIPVIRSETATQLQYKAVGGSGVLAYSYDGCPKGSKNEITLTYNIPGNRIVHNVYFTVPRVFNTLKVKGEAAIAGVIDANNAISDISVRITLEAVGYAPYTVKNLRLKLPALMAPVYVEDINEEFNADGVSELRCSSDIPVQAYVKKENRLDILQGELVVVHGGKAEIIKFTQPYKLSLARDY